MPDDPKDPDGLPTPSDAFLAALGREAPTGNEALTTRPKATDWAVLVAGLRWAAEIDRRGNEDANVPEGTTGPRIALKALIAFLLKQDCVERHGAHVPLVRLAAALADLGDGIVSPLFRPTVRHPGAEGPSVRKRTLRAAF
jgi:hypothetical protein